VQAFAEVMASSTSSSTLPFPTILPPEPEYQKATGAGEKTLWVVTVLMGLSSLAFYAMAMRVPANKRLFHILTAFITTFAFISYYAMATHDGISYIHVQHTLQKTKKGFPNVYQDVYRQVYWARYVDWFFTTPLLLLDLSFLAGLNGASILVTIVADLIMVATGLFAAYAGEAHDGGKKWGYYAWACIAFLTIVYQLVLNGRKSVATKGDKTSKFFYAIAGYTLIIWMLYPIIWGVADGSRKINIDSEIIAYAILDILAKPVFGFWLLFTHDSVPETGIVLDGFWAHGADAGGSIRVGDDEDGA